jgi:hypothetical protein
VETCQFGSAKRFLPCIFAHVAEAGGKRHYKASVPMNSMSQQCSVRWEPVYQDPSIKWSPGFDDRCLPGAYISIFFKVKGILPQVENMCTRVKPVKLLVNIIFHLIINIFGSNDKICFILQCIEITLYRCIMHYAVLSSWIPQYIYIL